MTLEQAQQLRVGDIIDNCSLGRLTVIGPVYYMYDTYVFDARDGYTTHPSFVALSTLVKRNVPDHMALPLGV